jgi:DNA polymerase III epsilon subunit-like protein
MIIVDIEASGTDPQLHSIVSIGAVDFNDPSNRFYEECRIDDDRSYTDEALQVNGFSVEEITDQGKQTVPELLNRYFAWAQKIPDKTIAGQNVDFDKLFINESCKKHQLPNRIDKRIIDLHGLCYAKHLALKIEIPLVDESSGLNTDSILKFTGLEERLGAHNALNDALLEAEAFSRLIYGKNLLAEYRPLSVPAYLLPNDFAGNCKVQE